MKRYPDEIWERATNESFKRVKPTCNVLNDKFLRARISFSKFFNASPDESLWLKNKLDDLFTSVREDGTEKLRRQLVREISKRIMIEEGLTKPKRKKPKG